jgi:hypothetical protein
MLHISGPSDYFQMERERQLKQETKAALTVDKQRSLQKALKARHSTTRGKCPFFGHFAPGKVHKIVGALKGRDQFTLRHQVQQVRVSPSCTVLDLNKQVLLQLVFQRKRRLRPFRAPKILLMLTRGDALKNSAVPLAVECRAFSALLNDAVETVSFIRPLRQVR